MGDGYAGGVEVERFLPLARHLARRYHGSSEPLDDLVQVASLGLVKAAHRFDERRGVSFGTYAAYAITGELKRHFRDRTWAVHVPRGAKERAVKVNQAIRESSEERSAPSEGELAERVGLSEREVLDARQTWLALEASSLDAPAGGHDEPEPPPLAETIGCLDGGYECVENKLTLEAAVGKLPVRERRMLRMRFIEDRTQADIAARLGVSQMQVSGVLREALEHLEAAADTSSTGANRVQG